MGTQAQRQAAVGIVMLESRFPRIPGDVGNAATWDFPVLYQGVSGALPGPTVRSGAPEFLEAFVEAGRDLIAQGASGIATSCGFLVLHQEALRTALGVPVLSSALLQVPMVAAMLAPDRQVGVLTISGQSLGAAHLAAAGAPPDTPVGSTEGGAEFTRAILGNAPRLDVTQAEADNVAAARALVARAPQIGALVLECTNMVPYAAAIRAATGRPVFTIETAIRWFQAGLVPRSFPRP